MSDYYGESLIRQVIEKPAFLYSGVRKIVQDITWEVDRLPVVTFEQLGYSKNKLKQLQRNYVNEEEFDRVLGVLTKRSDQSFTSVALSLRGKPKDSRSMGHCMLSLVVTRGNKLETVEIQYRSTELILKFGGDLAFMPWVFDQLGLNPDLIRFRFANAYLSGVFFPTLCSMWDPIDFFDLLWKKDKKLFAAGTRFFLRSAYKKEQHFPYSPENQQHKFLWARVKKAQIDRIRDYLERKHLTFGKELPKIHYGLHEEYIPRSKKRQSEDE